MINDVCNQGYYSNYSFVIIIVIIIKLNLLTCKFLWLILA